MFGIGVHELIILMVIGLLTVVPVVVVIGVVIWLMVRKPHKLPGDE